MLTMWIYLGIGTFVINVIMSILLIIHMIKFGRMNRNFNKVVNNVQNYLSFIMKEQEQQEQQEDEREKEELLGQVLGELFS